ncbi:GntR family transcriptional regulator [Saccharothrix sp. NRRL B-16348]|uniref:GntR family transcriptional regulator n=1 Tax=Saccharothrix sp. NRRL B-16348 TaxID=1415542 RepID=UPI0006AD8AE6|nr:GntR family transcriptional regulator [Saccharothrix sp. NRRL B-16348]KOX12778.1 GntR family transcriptional regulator [Saccharothrix sp. NRRL B-16348]
MLQLGQVDRGLDQSPAKQIAAMLREAVRSGALAPGEQLPSEAQLIEHFGVARMTVRNALQELRNEGLVMAEHGKGTFVRPMPPVRRMASDRFARKHRKDGKAAFLVEADKVGYQPGVDQISVTRGIPPRGVAERLRLEPDAEVVIRARRYLADGRPVETAVSYIPAAMATGTRIEEPDSGPGGIYARLEEQGYVLDKFTEEVGARMPTPDERRTLEIGDGVPVLLVLRTAYDTDGVAVEVCDTVKVAPAYLLEYDFPAR